MPSPRSAITSSGLQHSPEIMEYRRACRQHAADWHPNCRLIPRHEDHTLPPLVESSSGCNAARAQSETIQHVSDGGCFLRKQPWRRLPHIKPKTWERYGLKSWIRAEAFAHNVLGIALAAALLLR
jgi:hypothetical protein